VGRAFADLAFTADVRAMQSRMGSRTAYARLDARPDAEAAGRVDLGAAEAAFIEARDGFYQASVGQTGWPYVQFRGGAPGFLKVLDAHTIGYADLRGNRQYVSVGNLQRDARVALILMDYAQRRRLKLLGQVRIVEAAEDPALMARLAVPGERTPAERAVLIDVQAFDWNCPQHITPRWTEAEIDRAVAPLHAEIAQLRARLAEVTAEGEAKAKAKALAEAAAQGASRKGSAEASSASGASSGM
jgi:predicted pyridoxine 5'-phosphate oxidase superfamily flavin-nucleotide-binding protein